MITDKMVAGFLTAKTLDISSTTYLLMHGYPELNPLFTIFNQYPFLPILTLTPFYLFSLFIQKLETKVLEYSKIIDATFIITSLISLLPFLNNLLIILR